MYPRDDVVYCFIWITVKHHEMEIFSVLLALCGKNPPVTGEFPHKDQWGQALMFSLIYAWTNGWANNRDTGDLGRHRTIMTSM